MTTPKFQIGQVVRLNSDSIKMTVESIATNTGLDGIETFDGYYKCTWIDGEQKTGIFHEDTLTPIG